jgi:hypothetical protein
MQPADDRATRVPHMRRRSNQVIGSAPDHREPRGDQPADADHHRRPQATAVTICDADASGCPHDEQKRAISAEHD